MGANLHNVTKVRPKQFVLRVGHFGDKMVESDCVGSLDLTGVSGREAWRIEAVFPNTNGGPDWWGCIVSVDPAGFADRSGRIKQLAQAWLQRLEQSGGLYAAVTEYDGGDEGVEFPVFVVSND